jgi:hypothetical protein
MNIKTDILPPEVEPAQLHLNDVHTLSTDKYIDFQKYMTKKYPKLTDMLYFVFVTMSYLEYCLNQDFIPQIQQITPYLTLTLMHQLFQKVPTSKS